MEARVRQEGVVENFKWNWQVLFLNVNGKSMRVLFINMFYNFCVYYNFKYISYFIQKKRRKKKRGIRENNSVSARN